MSDVDMIDPIQIGKLKAVENDIRIRRDGISNSSTPKEQVKTRPDGMDYIEEGYMRHLLNKHYPLWSWNCEEVQFLGAEWVWVRGTLTIVEEGVPRKFGSVGATRVQFKRGAPHTPENIVDIDKNVASANTDSFKRAVNRLCNIGDDVYRKQIKEKINDNLKDDLLSLAGNDTIKRKLNVMIDRLEIHVGNYNEWYDKLEKPKKKEKE